MSSRTFEVERLARQLAEGHAYQERVWWVVPASPLRGVWATADEAITLVAAIYGMGADGPHWVMLPPQADGQRWVDLGEHAGPIAAHEGFMPVLVACLRRNGVRGRYRRAGEEKAYQIQTKGGA